MGTVMGRIGYIPILSVNVTFVTESLGVKTHSHQATPSPSP